MPGAQAIPIANEPKTASGFPAGQGDAELVERARREPAAFGALFERYATRVYWYAFYRLGAHDAADDAVAVTFERALVNLPTCRPDRFRAWLFTIARNVVTDLQRDGAVRAAVPLDRATALVDPRPDPAEVAAHTEGQVRVRRLLARLPEGQRRIVELRLAGLTGAEIARVLGRTQVAVRVSQYRAYAQLREILASEPEALDGTR